MLLLMATMFLCIGFEIAILYIDLQFDMLALPHRKSGGLVPEHVLAQFTTYYGVVTKNPYLLMFVLMTTLIGIIVENVYSLVPPWAGYSSLVLILLAMGGGIIKVIPSAQRLAADKDTLEDRSRMVYLMFPAHFFILICILLLAVAQSSWAL